MNAHDPESCRPTDATSSNTDESKALRKTIFLVFAIAGTIWPMLHFISWMATNGVDLNGFIADAFGHGVSAGAWADLLISSFVFWIFLFAEGRRRQMGKLWVYPILNLFIGLSLALPLFLFFREDRL